MNYHLIDRDPLPAGVSRMTLIPFLSDGRCVANLTDSGPELPSGPVRRGEHYLLDTSLRVTLMATGFHRDRVHPFAAEGRLGDTHVFAWIDGSADTTDPVPDIAGDQNADETSVPATSTVRLMVETPEVVAAALDRAKNTDAARAVRDAQAAYLRHRRDLTDGHATSRYSPLVQTLAAGGEPAGDGESTAPDRITRRMIVDNILDGINRGGSFLDLGCGDGLVMAWVSDWAGERGLDIAPYGVEGRTEQVRVARQRMPHWDGRIQVGNPANYRPHDDQRFTFVHLNTYAVPQWRRADAVRNALENLVENGGRLLVTSYHEHSASGPAAALLLRRLGYQPVGQAHSEAVSGVAISSAWIDNHGQGQRTPTPGTVVPAGIDPGGAGGADSGGADPTVGTPSPTRSPSTRSPSTIPPAEPDQPPSAASRSESRWAAARAAWGRRRIFAFT